MGVYIDMEMPVFEHQSWDIRKGADGKWYVVDTNAETSDGVWHEIVSVPPHGRLIDADALHKLFEAQWHYLQVLNWNENPTAEAKQTGVNWCINTLHDEAPTIIQASGGSET